jgi:hypothetical protein
LDEPAFYSLKSILSFFAGRAGLLQGDAKFVFILGLIVLKSISIFEFLEAESILGNLILVFDGDVVIYLAEVTFCNELCVILVTRKFCITLFSFFVGVTGLV